MKSIKVSLVVACFARLALPLNSPNRRVPMTMTTASPATQWMLISGAWNKREYTDAASMMMTYSEGNPDEDHALESWYDAFEVYRAYRPNPAKQKEVFDKAVEADARWTRKYADSNRERASSALWYQALEDSEEGQQAQAESNARRSR